MKPVSPDSNPGLTASHNPLICRTFLLLAILGRVQIEEWITGKRYLNVDGLKDYSTEQGAQTVISMEQL
jgi:hypothetical protein